VLAESRRMKLVKYALSECVGAGVSIRFEDLEAGWEKSGLSGPEESSFYAHVPRRRYSRENPASPKGGWYRETYHTLLGLDSDM